MSGDRALVIAALTLVAVGGTAVVLTGRPSRQAVSMSVFGVLLAVLFVVLQAPDVALSQVAVGTALVPLMVMLAVRKIDRDRTARQEGTRDRDGTPRQEGTPDRDGAAERERR